MQLDCTSKSGIQTVNQHIMQYRMIEKLVRRLDAVVAFSTLVLYMGQVLELLDLLRPRKPFEYRNTPAEYGIHVAEHVFVLLLSAVTHLFLHDQAKTIIPLLHELLADATDLRFDQRCKIFGQLNHWSTNCAGFTLWNTLVANREFMVSLFGIIVTYALVLEELAEADVNASRHRRNITSCVDRFWVATVYARCAIT
ncbi:uncharacterized protein LOC129589662 [Paramacrobiotus metropolitanus]|uniref:uncharacterized protein LOC129589662 n=1 Tax=Paramacrobiotus metropolitanus TaxID=2943436 RepID=UPI0024458F62|nr:uncharacterized protein LOC129589662 [Paramacrobiotus metropolitanus]